MSDLQASLDRARLSLEGLSVGDAFGERFFGPVRAIKARLESRDLPRGPWRWTDDTAMALGVMDVLARHGRIEPDDLALTFGRRYVEAPGRGYGRGVRDTLDALATGADWRRVAPQAFASHVQARDIRTCPVSLVSGRTLGTAAV